MAKLHQTLIISLPGLITSIQNNRLYSTNLFTDMIIQTVIFISKIATTSLRYFKPFYITQYISHLSCCSFLFKIHLILLLIVFIYNSLLRTKQTLSYLSLLKSTLRYFKPFYVTQFCQPLTTRPPRPSM